MSQRVRVAASSEIPAGGSRECVVGDRIVAVFHTAEGWFAIDGICAHAGGPVAQGKVSGGIVTCPWHGWRFDPLTGISEYDPSISISTYPTHLDGNEILADLP